MSIPKPGPVMMVEARRRGYRNSGRNVGRRAMVATKPARWRPDPAVEDLVSSNASRLGVSNDDLVTEAVHTYLETRRREKQERLRQTMRKLDGTNRSRLALLTGLTPEQIDAVGGVRED